MICRLMQKYFTVSITYARVTYIPVHPVRSVASLGDNCSR